MWAYYNADSDKEAEQAYVQGEKTLQDKAKDAAGSMSRSIQEAYDNTKAKAQS